MSLPSYLHIQKSEPGYKKGHNYFRYDSDLVVPILSFLRNHVPAYMSKAAVTMNMERVKEMGIVPKDFVEKCNLPPTQHAMTERSLSQEEEGEEGGTNHNSPSPSSSSSSTSVEENSNNRISACRQMTTSMMMTLPSCHCLCCPCTLLCEVLFLP